MRSIPVPGFAAVAVTLALGACGTPPSPPAAPPTPAVLPAPPEFIDLVGTDASRGEAELTKRGYQQAKTQGTTTFWYHAPSNTCLRVVTANGRYRRVSQTLPENCGY